MYRRHAELCGTKPKYRELYREGKDLPDKWKLPPPILHGMTGTHLKRLLKRFGLTEKSGCGCGSHARQMDVEGPDWCEENSATVIDWMRRAAKKREILFVDCAARYLLRMAIRLARREARKLARESCVCSVPARPVTYNDSRLNVGLIGPCLLSGGGERWQVEVAGSLDPEKIHVVGIGIRRDATDKHLEAKARKIAPLVTGDEACKRLADMCDMVIEWGWQPPIETNTPRVFVAQGDGPWATGWTPSHGSIPVAVSRKAVLAYSFQYRHIVHVQHNAVDLSRLETTADRATLRKAIGLNETDIAVAYIGRIFKEKNAGAAAAAVEELGAPYRAVYKGWGQLAKDLPRHPSKPIILPYEEQVGDTLRAIDCFMLASPTEGMSLALCEAWAAGVPTVCTPVGAVPELEEMFGPLTVRVPIDATSEQLAAAVKQSLSAENATTVERAKQMVIDHFTIPKMGERWTNFLLRVANSADGIDGVFVDPITPNTHRAEARHAL